MHLVSDMARNHNEIEHRFAKDPNSVLSQYDLSPKEIALLKSQDADAIASHIGEQSKQLLQTLATAQPHEVGWPLPSPTIKSVTPNTASLGATTRVKVTGTNFHEGAALVFVAGSHKVSATVHSVVPGPNSSLEASAVFTQAGTYNATLSDSSGSSTLPNAITAR